MLEEIGPDYLPGVYKIVRKMGMGTGAFEQLTTKYAREVFNPATPDVEGVRYFSYGARLEPRLWSVFRASHGIVQKAEGANDGLVSVSSSRWGVYKGTLVDVSHLDLINWTNRLRYALWALGGFKRKWVYFLMFSPRVGWFCFEPC